MHKRGVYVNSYKAIKAIKFFVIIIYAASTIIVGCEQIEQGQEIERPEPSEDNKQIVRYQGELSQVLSFVHTTNKQLSLTFNGLADDLTMKQLLSELDAYGVKATFFLPGIRVAEEPNMAKDILSRGHEIANNTLSQSDMSTMSYEQVYKEVQLCNQIIFKELGIKPKFVRTRSGDYTDDIRAVAAQLGMEAVVSYTINPRDRDMQDAVTIGKYIERYMSRGGIIALNTDINPEVIPAISLIAEAAKNLSYQLVTLSTLHENGYEAKPLEQIPGYDAAIINSNYQQAQYELIYKVDVEEKQVALTFDDWGTDKTVTEILEILDDHGVVATFFLRANGVENNPNLAKAIVEAGHDVANHTYTHPVITTIPAEKLQAEIVKAHQVITEAIQQKPTMLFRPPTGEIDHRTAQIVAATGYSKIAMYDVTALDWDSSNSADDIVRTITNKTEAGSVILLHMLDDIHTIEALPTIINKLKERGFTFVTMADMIQLEGEE